MDTAEKPTRFLLRSLLLAVKLQPVASYTVYTPSYPGKIPLPCLTSSTRGAGDGLGTSALAAEPKGGQKDLEHLQWKKKNKKKNKSQVKATLFSLPATLRSLDKSEDDCRD